MNKLFLSDKVTRQIFTAKQGGQNLFRTKQRKTHNISIPNTPTWVKPTVKLLIQVLKLSGVEPQPNE